LELTQSAPWGRLWSRTFVLLITDVVGPRLLQINPRDSRGSVAFEGLEHQDEPRAFVLLEARQAFAERAAVHQLTADFGAAAQGGGDGFHRVADLDLLAVEQQ
jgi:hypothetical protein